MDRLIPIINRLQDILASVGFSNEKIDLPQIAVVGAQSVGKSSIIEALVCKDFLPRGTGIVTRRPLLLQLRHVDTADDWAEFLHLPGKQFHKFDQVRQEISNETDRGIHGDKCVSPDPISLKIFSSRVVDLTLIDLPGIIKVPVGDQPPDIEEQVKSLISQYIKKPNCIILAITAASTDIANSDSLKLAREVDPNGNRTIGVISKCDTFEETFDILDLLLGKLYPLKLGYVGVVCRNQRQTMDNKCIEDSLCDEANFFSSNPKYKLLRNCGTAILAEKLNQILLYHIIEALPEVKVRLSNLLFSTEKELSSYGDPFVHEENPGALLLNFFSRFSRHFEDAVEGRLVCQPTGQLTAGARINYIFNDWYTRILREFNPLTGLSDLEIRTTIRNTAGPKTSLFVPEAAFEILVKRQIRHLEPPSLKCVEQVYRELQDIVEKCDLPEMKRYTNLREHILSVVKDVLARLLEPSNKMIQNIIQMETAYINISHPDFLPNVLKILNTSNVDVAPAAAASTSNPVLNHVTTVTKQTNIEGRSKTPTQNKVNEPVTLSSTKVVPISEPPISDTSGLTQPSSSTSSGIFAYFWKGRGSRAEDAYDPHLSSPNNVSNGRSISFYESLQDVVFGTTPGYISLPNIPSRIVPTDPPTDREILEERLIKALIHTYFCIVRQSVADFVPKAIMYFMVNSAKEVIPRQLVATLYKDALYQELLKESEHVVQKRAHLKDLQKKLKEAVDIINTVPDSLVSDFQKHYWENG